MIFEIIKYMYINVRKYQNDKVSNEVIITIEKFVKVYHIYCTRAIISRGLYIFYPIFEDQFFVFKDVF